MLNRLYPVIAVQNHLLWMHMNTGTIADPHEPPQNSPSKLSTTKCQKASGHFEAFFVKPFPETLFPLLLLPFSPGHFNAQGVKRAFGRGLKTGNMGRAEGGKL